MLDIFIGFFGNTINIVISLIFVLIGILIGIIIVRYLLKPKNQILYCRERDGRAEDFDIADEDAISLETKTNPTLRFFKFGRSYELRKRGRSFTKFFGKEGTAYTWRLQGFGGTKTKPKQVQHEFDTMEDAVLYKWGKNAYEIVPEDMKGKLRDNKVLLTVNLEPGIVPEGYKPITESVIKKKANEDVAKLIGEGLKGVIKKDLLERIAWIGCGIGIGLAIHIFLL